MRAMLLRQPGPIEGRPLALAGIYMTPVPELDYTRHLYHEKTLRTVANATRQDARDFLRLAAEIPVRTQVETFGLEDANEALLRLKRGQIQGAAVIQIVRSQTAIPEP